MSADGERPGAARTYRTVIRSARFTPEEWATVQERAAAVGLSPSRFLRPGGKAFVPKGPTSYLITTYFEPQERK